MARLAGLELQDNWKVDYALTKIKGIGWSTSKEILENLNLPSSKRISDLTSEELTKIASELEKKTTEGELVRQTRSNIQRLQAVGTYRGIRHSKGLPARGQRTRSNARTKRGKRKTVGAFKKEALVKQAPASKE